MDEIKYSLGTSKYDNLPEQCVANDFDDFAEKMLATTSKSKGQTFFSAAFKKGLSNKDKNKGENHWRCEALALPRRFQPFDIDGLRDMEAMHEVILFFSQWSCFWYTTASHLSHEKGGLPRIRIVVNLSREVSREESMRLGRSVEILLEKALPDRVVNWDRSVYQSEQPCYNPVERSSTGDPFQSGHELSFISEPLDVDAIITEASPDSRKEAQSREDATAERDPVYRELDTRGMIKGRNAAGMYNVECPFSDEHSSDSSETSTVYYLPKFGGYDYGKFHCMHDHCKDFERTGEHRPQSAYIQALGLDPSRVWAEQIKSNFASGQAQELSPEVTGGIEVFGLKDFMADLSDLHFIWRLILRKGWIYALTANPGAGKTAIALYLSLMLALGKKIHGRETERCRVLYLCGENPDDVRMRFALLMDRHGVKMEDIDGKVYFTKRPFSINEDEAREAFISNASEHGPFDFCVVDTGAAHSSVDDENDNRAMHDLAIAIREAAGAIGQPCVIALMHPVKNATRDNLLPRGGSSFTGSIDGVLCAWRDGQQPVELFPHPSKFRGEHFKSMYFELEPVEHPTIQDNFGFNARTVIATETDPPSAAEAKADVFLMIGADLDALRMIQRIEDDGDWVGISQSGTTPNNLWRWRNHTAFPASLKGDRMKNAVLQLVEDLLDRGWLVREHRMPANKKSNGRKREEVDGVWITELGKDELSKSLVSV